MAVEWAVEWAAGALQVWHTRRSKQNKGQIGLKRTHCLR